MLSSLIATKVAVAKAVTVAGTTGKITTGGLVAVKKVAAVKLIAAKKVAVVKLIAAKTGFAFTGLTFAAPAVAVGLGYLAYKFF